MYHRPIPTIRQDVAVVARRIVKNFDPPEVLTKARAWRIEHTTFKQADWVSASLLERLANARRATLTSWYSQVIFLKMTSANTLRRKTNCFSTQPWLESACREESTSVEKNKRDKSATFLFLAGLGDDIIVPKTILFP